MTISKSNAERPSLQESIAKLQETYEAKVAEGKIKPQQEKPQQLYLPWFPEELRAIPNHLARSSLFAPIRRGRRKCYIDEVLVSRSDAEIHFWGQQLDEGDCDVWLQAVKEALEAPLGEAVSINRAEFLRQIGRPTNNTSYKWLNESMKRLAFAMLTMTVRYKDGTIKAQVGEPPVDGKEELCFHLVQEWSLNEKTNNYRLRMSPALMAFFSTKEYGFLNCSRRFAITGRGTDLAKSLQRLLATSGIEQRYNLEYLCRRAQYERMRDFRVTLRKALEELKRIGIIAEWRLEVSTHGKEQAVIDMPITVQMEIAPDQLLSTF